jgi:hypothetical protein
MCVNVPVIFARPSAHPNAADDTGIRAAANAGSVTNHGHSWPHRALASATFPNEDQNGGGEKGVSEGGSRINIA